MIRGLVFIEPLIVSPFGDGTYWYLRAPLRWIGGGRLIVVPAGFVTDFASVPRAVWWLFPRWAKYGNAAVVHDWLYWTRLLEERKAVDEAILEGMCDMKVHPISRTIIYRILRLFGWIAWNANKRARDAGRKRCIERFPTDPLMHWSEYEQSKGVECIVTPVSRPNPEALKELLSRIPNVTVLSEPQILDGLGIRGSESSGYVENDARRTTRVEH